MTEEKTKREKILEVLKIISTALGIIIAIITILGLIMADYTILFLNDNIIDTDEAEIYGTDYSNYVYERDIIVKKSFLYFKDVDVSLFLDESLNGVKYDIIENELEDDTERLKKLESYTIEITSNEIWREGDEYTEEDIAKNGKYNLEVKGISGDETKTLSDMIEINHAASIIEPKTDAMVSDRADISGKLSDGKLVEGYNLYIVAYLPEIDLFYPQSIAEIDNEGNWTAEIDLSDKEFINISQARILALVGDGTADKEYQDYMNSQDKAGWRTVADGFHLSSFVDITLMPEVCITNLNDNETIGTMRDIQGTVKHLGEYDMFVVVYSYENEMYYPQRINEISPDGVWDETVYFGDEKDSEESFRLMVPFAKGEAAQYINDYIDDCEEKQLWPGLKALPEDILIGYSVDILREKVKPLAEGSISYPEESAIVTPQETVEGVITDTQENVTVFLVVYSCAADKYYPLKRLEPNELGEWSATVYFGEAADSGNGYKLIMVAVQANAAKEYQDYLNKCEDEQSWPGMRTLIDGSQTVHEVALIRD